MYPRKSWKTLSFVLLALVWVVSATSCAPQAPAPQEGAAPAEPMAEEPTEALSSITMLIPEDPVAFNGIVTDTGYEQLVGELIMLSVAEIDPYGVVFPEIAVEIPTLDNGGVVFDEENWTMDVTWKIRDDIFWSDGEQLTVDDIIFTWNAFADPDLGAWTDGQDYTDSVEKIDDFTFKVYYNTVYTAYQTQFGGENFFVYPEHYCDASQGVYEWDCEAEPLSSGPYVLEEFVTNDHLTFAKNPNYFEEGKPAIDQVIVKIVPEQSVRRTMMMEGDADHHMWPPDAIQNEYEAASNVTLQVSPTDRWVMRLFMNQAAFGSTDPVETPHPFFSDLRVRQAVRMAVDVDTIINDIFLGHGHPVWTEFFRPPYNVCDIPRPDFDPEGAKALLEEAGWIDTDNDGVRECRSCPNANEGDRMEFEFGIYSEYGEELELAQQYVAENLSDIGMKATLLSVEGAVLWDTESGPEIMGRFDMNMWDDGYPGLDPTDNDMWYYYHTDAADPESGGWNIGRWSNEDFDAYYDELFSLDEDYRKEVFCEMARILDEEIPQVLLFSTLEVHGVSSRLQNTIASANDPFTWNVADWTLAE
ncbi:MAG TPA: peptide ABC transporter substrate-binding protein [Anaerolineales bacterium]|nr:peptide ABC transporter substrate-binding protein [Anaerolineales bacterium]